MQSNQVKGSELWNSSFNNKGVGSQFNNEGGNQNVVLRGILIERSVFNGNVHFGLEEDESSSKSFQKLCDWLQSNHHIEECYDSIRSKVNGTYDSILENPEFISWRLEPSISPKWLWVHGLPTFRRTVLCAQIIEHIKDEKKEAIAYYFFSPDLESHRDPMASIRSWLYQMAFINTSVLDAVSKKRKQDLRAKASQAVIMELFREAIKILSNCTLIIDGLDECKPSNFCLSVAQFVRKVNEAVQSTNTKILVTSRSKSVEMQKFFDENTPSRTMRTKWPNPRNDGWVSARSPPATTSCYAIEFGIATLFKKGRIFFGCNSSIYTTLGAACSQRCENLTHELYAIGAKVGIKDASSTGYTELDELALDSNADITTRDHDGISHFPDASTNGHLNKPRRLIQKILKSIRKRRAAMAQSSKQASVTTSN